MRRLISNHIARAGVAAALLSFAIPGCRHADLNRELVERELRLQEDELYRLHDEIAEREKLLESARRENAVLKRELQGARAVAPVQPEQLPAVPPAPDDVPPTRVPRSGSGVPPTEVTPPKIEVPGLEGPPPAAPGNGRSSWRSTRGVRAASYEEDLNQKASHVDSTTQAQAAIKDDRVAKIVLNRRLTGGFDADRRLGDEGIRVVIEPRDANDQIVERAGDVAVVVIDPALSGPDARVARWDFRADEIGRRFQKTALGEGIHLDLRWPARPPQHERLMLFVRLTTSEGESFEASQPILIDLTPDADVSHVDE